MRTASSAQLQRMFNIAKDLYDSLRATERTARTEPDFSSARDKYNKMKRAKSYPEEWYEYKNWETHVTLQKIRNSRYVIHSTKPIKEFQGFKYLDKYEHEEMIIDFAGGFYVPIGEEPTPDYRKAVLWFTDFVYHLTRRTCSNEALGKLDIF